MRTWSRRAAAVVVLALAAALGAVTPASAAPPPSGWYELVNVHSGKCLDGLGWGTAFGTPTGQWDCLGGPNQQWQLRPVAGDPAFVTLLNGHSGTCLTAPFGTPTSLTPVGLEPCRGLTGQVWRLVQRTDGAFELQYTARDGAGPATMCLDMRDASLGNGGRAVTHRCMGGAPHEAWRFRPSPPPQRSTPRIQMFTGAHRAGDKLDADAPKTVTNMLELGRCTPFCSGSWNDLVNSIDTGGGGQDGAYVRVWMDVHLRGACLEIPVGTYIDNLSQVEVLRYPSGRLPVSNAPLTEATFDWSHGISSFEVTRYRLPVGVCDYARPNQLAWDPDRPPMPRP